MAMPHLAQASDGEWFSLGTLGGSYSSSVSISADGSVVAGTSITGTGENHLFLWRNGVMTDLGNLRETNLREVGDSSPPNGLAINESYSLALPSVVISADGSAVTGGSETDTGTLHAFRWSNGEMQDLGTLGGNYSSGHSISADGSAVAGSSETGTGENHAFIWRNGVMTDIGNLGEINLGPVVDVSDQNGLSANQSYSMALPSVVISADGSAVTGGSETDTGEFYAFRWSNGEKQSLGSLGGSFSFGAAISANGSVVAGNSTLTGGDASRAFRWNNGVMTDLGTLGGRWSSASVISADGLVVAGTSLLTGDDEIHPFRWSNGVMTDLGTLTSDASPFSTNIGGIPELVGGIEAPPLGDIPPRTPGTGIIDNSFPNVAAISADGSVIVGVSGQAFRWSEADGMQSIADWTGVTDTGYSDTVASGVSANGQTVVGSGYQETLDQYTAWIARKGGIINPDQWLQSLRASQQVYQSGEYLTSLALDGSHHRPLALYANTTGSDTCMWVNGDVGNYGYGRDATVGLAEVGVCGSSGNLTFGAGIGNAWQHQDFDYDGNQRVDGQFFTGEVNWLVPNTPLLLSALAMYGSYNADTKRGYANGTGQASSDGSTDLDSSALRLRVDWLDAFTLKDVSLTPWTSVTATKTNVDAYTETSGPFPASFDSQSDTATEARLGLTGRFALTNTTTLSGTVETVHSFDDQGPNLSGDAVGLFSFDQSGQDIENDWQRVGVEVDQQVGKSGLISVSLYGANKGQDANGSLAVKYLHRF
jgi:probable HAF family extracellular repeat protein